MIHKTQSAIPQHVRIIFELPASVWADKVFLAGDFNEWRTDELQLRQGRDGTWRIALDLRANRRYQFRYLVDGRWQTESNADGFADNCHGSQNSVVDTMIEEAGVPAATVDATLLHPQAARVRALTYLHTLADGYQSEERSSSSRSAA